MWMQWARLLGCVHPPSIRQREGQNLSSWSMSLGVLVHKAEIKLCLNEASMPDLPYKDNSLTRYGYSKGAYFMNHTIQTKPYG